MDEKLKQALIALKTCHIFFNQMVRKEGKGMAIRDMLQDTIACIEDGGEE